MNFEARLPIIKAKSLTKKFGEMTAVGEVALDIRQGECFGLLGPNGAGKSTIINMLYGAARRSSGDLSVFGIDPDVNSREIKKRLGVVTQENALDESLTVVENLLLYAAFLGIPKTERPGRVEALLDYMNLGHKKDSPILFLSGGMKRRLVFVRALLGDPELVILDEPTTGLDPAVRHLIWGKVKELKSRGITILLMTHYMHEAEILCDRLAIMNKGSIVTEGSPKELIKSHTPGVVGVFSNDDETTDRLKNLSGGFTSNQDSSGVYLRAPNFEELARINNDLKLIPLQIRPANLEDVFLKITGEELSADA